MENKKFIHFQTQHFFLSAMNKLNNIDTLGYPNPYTSSQGTPPYGLEQHKKTTIMWYNLHHYKAQSGYKFYTSTYKKSQKTAPLPAL